MSAVCDFPAVSNSALTGASGFQQPLSFVSIYQERLWGGRAFAECLGRSLPKDTRFGESWEIVDRETAQSVVASGPNRGLTLNELWVVHHTAVFGDHLPISPRFPLLFKLLDAEQDLSVQVHPPEKMSKEVRGEPKTEAWYFLDAKPGAHVFAGFQENMDRGKFEAALSSRESSGVKECMHSISVAKGDALFIPSGRCHAIGSGCLVAEIQQNSDTTFRVFDWNRLSPDGSLRELHSQTALECIDFSDIQPSLLAPKSGTLVTCVFFSLGRHSIPSPRRFTGPGCAIFMVIEGVIQCGDSIFERGSTFLLPKSATHQVLWPQTPNSHVLLITINGEAGDLVDPKDN